jgi:CheY-like chemotaxis protein
VLLAEDEELSCLVATLMLQAGGLEVVTAKDGLAAVDLVGRQNFAAILMDMQMPLLDGVEATQRIRALPQGRTVPIIGLSANALTEDRMRALAAGMDEYLTKPVEPALLYQTLDRLILAQRVPHGAPNSAAPQAHQGA